MFAQLPVNVARTTSVIPAHPDAIRDPADPETMNDARRDQDSIRVVRRRDGSRELKTARPLESMDAAFEAIARMTLR